jgi:hypothetical protein
VSGTQRTLIAVSALVAATLGTAVMRTPTPSLGPTRLATETRPALGSGNVIAVRFAGRFPNQPSAPEHLTFTGDLLSPTGDVVGTLTFDIVCLTTVPFPCPVVDNTTTFRFPEGQIVSRAPESSALDPATPGFGLIGIHPAGDSIISATGAFKGRMGRAHMSGHHDGRELPGYATFDDFWLIELR